MDLKETLNKRYTVKEFDKNKKISEEEMNKVYDLLQLSPSSVNMQPWHFYVASTDEQKEKLVPCIEDYAFNKYKILDASHVIVFAAKTEIDEAYLNKVLEKEDQDGRYAKEEFKESNKVGRKFFLDLHKYDFKDEKQWLEKQVYLNAGHFVLGLKSIGIDSVIMEGFDQGKLDRSLGIREEGFTSILLIGIGYGSEEDFNAKVPKSRLNKDDVISEIK